MRRQPPSDFGARPSGEQMYGDAVEQVDTRPSSRSVASFSVMTEGTSEAEARFSERMTCGGPV